MPAHVRCLTPRLSAVAAALCLAAGCDPTGEETNSLRFEPGQLDLQAVEGSVDPADELVTLHHEGPGTISWSATCDQPWGTVSPSSGSMGSMTTMTVRVAADPQGLTAGTYSATVTATTGGESAVLAVEFTVTPATGPRPSRGSRRT